MFPPCRRQVCDLIGSSHYPTGARQYDMPNTHRGKVPRTGYRWHREDCVLQGTNNPHVPIGIRCEALSAQAPKIEKNPSRRTPVNRTEWQAVESEPTGLSTCREIHNESQSRRKSHRSKRSLSQLQPRGLRYCLHNETGLFLPDAAKLLPNP